MNGVFPAAYTRMRSIASPRGNAIASIVLAAVHESVRPAQRVAGNGA